MKSDIEKNLKTLVALSHLTGVTMTWSAVALEHVYDLPPELTSPIGEILTKMAEIGPALTKSLQEIGVKLEGIGGVKS